MPSHARYRSEVRDSVIAALSYVFNGLRRLGGDVTALVGWVVSVILVHDPPAIARPGVCYLADRPIGGLGSVGQRERFGHVVARPFLAVDVHRREDGCVEPGLQVGVISLQAVYIFLLGRQLTVEPCVDAVGDWKNVIHGHILRSPSPIGMLRRVLSQLLGDALVHLLLAFLSRFAALSCPMWTLIRCLS